MVRVPYSPHPTHIHTCLQAVRGDAVRSFDEVSAARGGLGRFPGSGVMTLIKQFAGVV